MRSSFAIHALHHFFCGEVFQRVFRNIRTLSHSRFKLCPAYLKEIPCSHTDVLQQASSQPFLTWDRLHVAVQLAEEAVAPLPSAWVIHPCHHHARRLASCLKQNNPVKLVSAASSAGACSCVHRSPGTRPCTLVIQYLASSVSRVVLFVSSERDSRHAPPQKHVISALVQMGVSTPCERRYQDQTLSPRGC